MASERYGSFLTLNGDITWKKKPLDAEFNTQILTLADISGYHSESNRTKGIRYEEVLCRSYYAHRFLHNEMYRDLICLNTQERIQAKLIADDHGGPPKVHGIYLHTVANVDAFNVGVFEKQSGILYKIFVVEALRLATSDKLLITSTKNNFDENGNLKPIDKQVREIALDELIKLAQISIDLREVRPDLYKDFYLSSKRSMAVCNLSSKIELKTGLLEL
jgi:hypothetical protein